MNKSFIIRGVKIEMNYFGIKVFTRNEKLKDLIIKYLFNEGMADREIKSIGAVIP